MDSSFLPVNAALCDYLTGLGLNLPVDSVERTGTTFLTYYDFLLDKTIQITRLSRDEFLTLTTRAVRLIHGLGEQKGTRMVHYFSGNSIEDLIIRTASLFLGTIPVTINWQSDTISQIDYKIEVTSSKIIFVDSKTPSVKTLKEKYPDKDIVNVMDIYSSESMTIQDLEQLLRSISPPTINDIRCIIFTSGTTGHPKGVELSYSNYRCNQQTFESFLGFENNNKVFTPIAVNPMHHTNTTSITDWALRRKHSELHLLERYTSQYWLVLASIAMNCSIEEVSKVANRTEAIVKLNESLGVEDNSSVSITNNSMLYKRQLVAPLVSRHIDFLDSLSESNSIGLSTEVLKVLLNIYTRRRSTITRHLSISRLYFSILIPIEFIDYTITLHCALWYN